MTTLPHHARTSVSLAFAALALACATEPEITPRQQTHRSQSQSPITTTSECDRERLERLISAPHDPATPAEARELCADPEARLIEIAEDTSARGLTRLRAIELLGALGGEAPVTRLARLARLADAKSDLAAVRRAALAALGRATSPASVTRTAAGRSALADADPHVREAAANLLRGATDAESRTALEQAQTREPESFVRAAIARALGDD